MHDIKLRGIRAITLATAIVLGFGAVTASAGTLSQPVSDGMHTYVVRFADLDINKVDGAAALYRRLRLAAGIVCDSLQSRDLIINHQYKVCTDRAVAAAVARVGGPVLSHYHESLTQGGKKSTVQLAKAE